MTGPISQEALFELARQRIYNGMDQARRDKIRRARRYIALQRRLDEGGADTEQISLMLQQANYDLVWESMELWPEEPE